MTTLKEAAEAFVGSMSRNLSVASRKERVDDFIAGAEWMRVRMLAKLTELPPVSFVPTDLVALLTEED